MACPACVQDARRLKAWRQAGGEIPAKTCNRKHGKPCRDCKKKLTRNPSRRCDECFNQWWKLEHGFVLTGKGKK